MRARHLLQATEHRPWIVPQRPWTMSQKWHDLLFLHWPVERAALARFVRPPLQLDTFDGQAWIGLIPFRLSDVRLRGLPPLPGLAHFTELNVRTYVRFGDQRGILFLSLDANHCVLAAIARRWYRLPYHDAKVTLQQSQDGGLSFSSRRHSPDALPSQFRLRYRPTSGVFHSTPGSLEHWLTERYCLYTFDRRDRLLRAEIHHPPWPLQSAEAEIELNTMLLPLGIPIGDEKPIVHFSRSIQSLIWTPEQVIASLSVVPHYASASA